MSTHIDGDPSFIHSSPTCSCQHQRQVPPTYPVTNSPTDSGERDLCEHISKTMGYWAPGGFGFDAYPEKTEKILQLIKADRARLLDKLEKAGPENVNGEELNITVSATALLGVQPRIVKLAQGEGWDMANYRWRSAIQALRTREGL